MTSKFFRYIGFAGAFFSILVLALAPGFPTPDKIFILLLFIFMAMGQAIQLSKRLLPFVAVLLTYESFRGLVPKLNTHVNFNFMIHMDRVLSFSYLPTIELQKILWHGSLSWYDYVLYIFYMMHFVLPFTMAIIIWKLRSKSYWEYVVSFAVTSYAGFLTFLLFPAAPPWMASDKGLIPQIVRIQPKVWDSLAIKSAPGLYDKISPNPVAAVPSLHAAFATLFVLFVYKLFGKKWGRLAMLYPVAIYFGTVYQGEHYLFDELAGGLLALIVFLNRVRLTMLAAKVYEFIVRIIRKVTKKT